MKKNIKLILVLSPLAFIFVFAYIISHRTDNKLQEKGKITIGKFDSIQEYPKRSYLGLSYYIANKRYTSFESSLHKGISKNDMGKFYKILYLPDSPEIIRGIYSKEIIDTVIILKAGFSRSEIGNLPKQKTVK
ncbi:hypothetical protein [Flavobacterium hungaricum]|uniref:Uncharacterized protein n=1 Tax=Flavobacterium hungaricum TaxID=2082725 RepID=A0ABR9TJD4_9FLAO|nr:hypothetical protein [Flavobacterium hungaricum]MBE8725380.1 hypothetical protein [Flavobacterium hungaricum]